MKVEQIGWADIGGRRYVLIYTDDGGAKCQRTGIRTISETPLWPHEELILALCEKISPGCSDNGNAAIGKEVKP